MIQKRRVVLAEAVKYDLYMKYNLTTVENQRALYFSRLSSKMAKVKYKLTNTETKHTSTEAMLASTELNIITLGRRVNSLEKHVEDLITATEVYQKIRNQVINIYIYRTAPDLSVSARNNIQEQYEATQQSDAKAKGDQYHPGAMPDNDIDISKSYMPSSGYLLQYRCFVSNSYPILQAICRETSSDIFGIGTPTYKAVLPHISLIPVFGCL